MKLDKTNYSTKALVCLTLLAPVCYSSEKAHSAKTASEKSLIEFLSKSDRLKASDLLAKGTPANIYVDDPAYGNVYTLDNLGKDSDTALVEQLFSAGADPNAKLIEYKTEYSATASSLSKRQCAYGVTPFMRLLDGPSSWVVVDIYLKHGAQKDAFYTLYEGEKCEIGTEKGEKISILQNVIYRPDTIGYLLKNEADPNYDCGGQCDPPLVSAISRLNSHPTESGFIKKSIEALILAGANPNKRGLKGKSAMELLEQYNLVDVKTLLTPETIRTN